jgi:PAS domain S-box-containing protein
MKTKTRKELLAEIEELRTRLEVSEETLRTLQVGDKAMLKEIAQLASFPELNPNPVMEVDLAGNGHYLNPAVKQLFPDLQMAGLQHPWLAGLKSLSKMLERERKNSHVREVKIGETWYEQTIYPVLEGKRLRIYGYDITARKQAEEALHESEKDLNRAQAVAHTGSWRLDIRRNELLWSDETHHLFGIPKGIPLTYEAFLATVHPDDRQMVDQSWQAALRGEPYDIEHRILVEGNIKWVRERAELEFDKEGSLRGGFGTVQDITERKQVEEKLKYSERKYRELYEGSQDGFILVDMEGHIKEFNHAYMEMLGYSEEELMRIIYMDLTPQKWHAMEAKIIQEQVLSKGYSTVYEKEYIKKDGTIFPISLRTYLIKETNGNPKGMWAFVRDITKRKEMEEALRRSRDELEIRVQEGTAELVEQSKILEGFFTSTITPLVFLDRDFNFIRVNEAYAKVCQRDISEFPEHNHFEFYPHEENEAIFKKVVETKTPYQAIARPFSFPDHPEWGITYWDWTLTPLLDDKGEVEFLVFSLEDVTERKRAEEALRASSLYARSLIEASLDPLVTISKEGKVTDVNRATELVTGASREELIGSDFSDYFTDPKRAREGYQEVFQEGMVKNYPLAIRHKSGLITEVLYNATLYKNEVGEVQSVFAAARDVTELNEIERRTRATNALLNLFVKKSSRKEYLDGVLELIQGWCGCRCAGIRVLGQQGNIPYESYSGFSREFWESENFLSVKNDQCVCIRVITGEIDTQDAPVITPAGSFCCANTVKFIRQLSEEEKKRYRGVCVENGYLSVAVIPISYGERILGAIHLADETENRVSFKSLEFIESMSPLIGEAINRFNLEDKIRESENRLRHLSSQLLTAQENERKRISREIHDSLGQSLSAIKFTVENITQQALEQNQKKMAEALEALIPITQASIEESRRIQMDLRPSILDDLGILPTLDWFCREYQKIYSQIHIEKETHIKENDLSPELKTVIYRVTQEALNNIAKHSKADLVKLSLRKQENKIQLTIQDNGQGFDLEEILSPDRSRRGMGLNSMRERIELSGGAFEIESAPGEGTTIKAIMPCSI